MTTFFQSNSFQPECDLPYANIMLAHYPSNHTYLECDELDLADALYEAVDAKDYPGMTDIDASLLYFCARIPFADHRIVEYVYNVPWEMKYHLTL